MFEAIQAQPSYMLIDKYGLNIVVWLSEMREIIEKKII